MKARLAVLLALALATPAAADPFAAVRVTTLPNGLTVALAPDSTAASVDVAVWVRAGSRFESPGQTGATHLIERLMFMGTAKAGPGEYARRVQAEGGTFSAFTDADQTCFESTVPPGALETVLRLEADRFGALELSQAKLDLALRSAREEARTRADRTAVGRGLRQLYALAWAGHPYRFPVVGLDEDLDRLSLRGVQAYRAARYVPGRMLLTVCGRIDPDAALAAVKRTLGALHGGPLAPDRPAPAPRAGARSALLVAEASMPVLVMGWRTPSGADPDGAALEVLSQVLVAGASSRIQRALVRAPDAPCTQAQGALDLRAEGGLLYVFASIAAGADTSRAAGAVEQCATALAQTPLEAAELEAAKRQLEADALFGWQTPGGMARALGPAWLATGDAQTPAKRLERVRAVTAADVQRVAARVLAPENRCTVWVLPSARSQEGRP